MAIDVLQSCGSWSWTGIASDAHRCFEDTADLIARKVPAVAQAFGDADHRVSVPLHQS